MQGFEELNEGGGLGGAQVLAIRWHVAAPLKNLPDQLILRETRRYEIQGWAPLSAHSRNRVAVTALLRLKDDSALALEWACIVRVTDRDRRTAAPGIHFRAPGREGPEMCKHTPCNGYGSQHDDCDRAFMPALFAFTCVKRKGYESCDSQHRGDQEKWCLQTGRKIRQYRIQPQEEEIRLPSTAAQTATAAMIAAEKKASFHTAPGTNGRPSFFASSWYSERYVARRTTRPGIGHSLMPSLTTIHT